jgi:hypothetical protein
MSAEIEMLCSEGQCGATLQVLGIADTEEKIWIEFDPGYIRWSMELWKAAPDMKIPVHETFKIHFMENRRSLLEGYVLTGKAWLLMLRPMTATIGAKVLAGLCAEVGEFIKWATDGLHALDALRPDL